MVLRRWEYRSDEGLTLETSASESLYGGQFTLSTQLIKPNYLTRQQITRGENEPRQNFKITSFNLSFHVDYDNRVHKTPVYTERINERKIANNRLLCAVSPPPPMTTHTLPLPDAKNEKEHSYTKAKKGFYLLLFIWFKIPDG